jgi:hypothetical protein
MRQSLHYRKSKKGRVFRAGRGTVKRSSQLRRDQIRKDLKARRPTKEKIVRIMEKDPLLYQEYNEVGRPKIRVHKGLLEKKHAFAMADLVKRDITIDKRLFKGDFYEPEDSITRSQDYKPEKPLMRDMPLIPRQLLAHEIQHLKHTAPRESEHKLLEDAAFWRSQFDIRKLHPSPKKTSLDIERGFRGPILKRDVRVTK